MSNEIAKRRKRTIEMTQGSLWKNMFFFSVPLIFSQILEVMFNLSDVAVVGHFADYKALGSVGSTTTLITLFTGLLIGLGSGVNVQVANKLGSCLFVLRTARGGKDYLCANLRQNHQL